MYIIQRGRSGRCQNSGAEVSFHEGPKCLLLGAEVSFHEGPKCLDEGPNCLFQKGPKCPIGAEVVGAEVVGAEVSKIPTDEGEEFAGCPHQET